MKKNSKYEENSLYVNGPVNAFRLEGTINNVKKNLYFFGDYHEPISAETKCDSFLSKDFINYFYETMHKTDDTQQYDLLYENYADVDMFEEHKYSKSMFREKYLDELRKYVDSDMDLATDVKIKNKGSKKFNNLRLHYLDVRSYYDMGDAFSLNNEVRHLFDNWKNGNKNWVIGRLIVCYANLQDLFIEIHNHLNEKMNEDDKIKNRNIKIDHYISQDIIGYRNKLNKTRSRREKYSKKIFGEYNDNNVKRILLDSKLMSNIRIYLSKAIDETNICIDKLLQVHELTTVSHFDLTKDSEGTFIYGPDITQIKKLMCYIDSAMDDLFSYLLVVFSNLTDIYLLRRILDKKYITTGIVYTGMYHTQNYVSILVKYFGFKITHADYTKLSLEETNKWLLNNSKDDPGKNLLKPVFKQCIDMSKFPPNFE